MQQKVQAIEWTPFSDEDPRPLGRHINHDIRSASYLVEEDGTVASASWSRKIPILDQGQVGSCTGNATVGVLGTEPDFEALGALIAKGLSLTEVLALKIYSDAEEIDGDGPYPPNDNGSSGLSVAKAAKNAGLISGYTHITSLGAAKTAIQSNPFITGSNWYDGMDSPDSSGLVVPTGSVRGGHEYECFAYDASADEWHFCNSWGTSFGVQGTFKYSSTSFQKLLSEDGDATVLLPLSAPAPTPNPPSDPTAVFAAQAHSWLGHHHVGINGTFAKQLQAWLNSQNL